MSPKKSIFMVLSAAILCSGCTSTRYLTDPASIDRQRDMRANRCGGNVGDVFINCANIFLAAVLNTPYEVYSGERAFKRISIVNESADSLYLNMVTDILWKEEGYCDIMGIALPSRTRQKLLVPYPAAYNIYFRTVASEEEKLEIRTDGKRRRIKLRAGMTNVKMED
jgi:hypothetical protein